MSTEPVPLREQVEMPQCRCVLTWTAIGRVDRCPDRTESPDDPLCAMCRAIHFEKQGHILATWSMAR